MIFAGGSKNFIFIIIIFIVRTLLFAKKKSKNKAQNCVVEGEET